MKTAFLVAITSAIRLRRLDPKWQIPFPYPPFTLVFKGKFSLHPHLKFLSKVLSEFHRIQVIHLSVCFPKLRSSLQDFCFYTLDVRRALAFYLDGTKQFKTTLRLFISFANRSTQFSISQSALDTHRLSRWISRYIYHLLQCCGCSSTPPLPLRVIAHSTRSQATSMPLLKNVLISEMGFSTCIYERLCP